MQNIKLVKAYLCMILIPILILACLSFQSDKEYDVAKDGYPQKEEMAQEALSQEDHSGEAEKTPPKPTINFSINPDKIKKGGIATLRWSTEHCDYVELKCTGSLSHIIGRRTCNGSSGTGYLNNPGNGRCVATVYGPGGRSSIDDTIIVMGR